MGPVLSRFRALVFAAICAGLLAGGAMALAHQMLAVPLIEQAEQVEQGGHGHGGAARRAVLTVATDVIAGIGFALLLAAAMTTRGPLPSLRGGVFWGAAGFATFSLAPAIGLPPELPGSAAAPLIARQLWWLATVICTGGGLALLAFRRRPWPVLAGLALLLAPHLLGAPHPASPDGAVPAALAQQFVVTTLAILALFWLLLGLACAGCLRRFRPGLTA